MIIIGSRDIGPTKYINEYIKDLKNVLSIRTNKNKQLVNDFKQISKFKDKKPQLILTGSCIGSGLDKELILYGKKNKIKSASFIEHWSLLKERFLVKKNKLLKPDYLFVIDSETKKFYIKNLKFKKENIFVIGSNYLNKINKIKKINKNSSVIKNILFISQPHKKLQYKLSKLFGIENYFGFSEYNVVNNILKNIDLNIINFFIKLHPNEKPDKFNILKKKKISILSKISKDQIIKKFDLIIGMDSMLLLELYLMGGKVLSVRPNPKNFFYGNRLKVFPIIEKINNFDDLKKIVHNYKTRKISFKKKGIINIIKKLAK